MMGLLFDRSGILLSAAVVVGVAIVLLQAAFGLFGGRGGISRDGQPLRTPSDTLPFVGNGLRFLQSRWKLFSWFLRCEREFGYETLKLTVPTLPPAVLINDPRNLEFVFKNEGIFSKGDFVKRRSWDLFGNGIINADGESWRVQRRAGLSFLGTATLRVITEVALPRCLAVSVAELRSAHVSGAVVDLQHVFHKITTALMGKLAYNMNDMQADEHFSQAFDFASGKTAERFQNPLWPITEMITGAEFRRSLATVKAFGRRIVANAVRHREDEKRVGMRTGEDVCDGKIDQISGSLIHSLLDAIGDEATVADAALTYLSAGRDTTGQALTWCFYLLMERPGVVEKIRQEVRTLLDERGGDQDGDLDVSPSSDLISNLKAEIDPTLFTPVSAPYTMAVFLEALRFYPPIPFEFRQCGQPVTLPDGTFLPAGSVLVWCLWAMQRSLITYGADADEFHPERWLVSSKLGFRVANRPASEFPVFNGGPRRCLGRKMAEAIAVQVIATVVWMFDLALDPGAGRKGRERTSKTSLTLPMAGGLPAVVRGSRAKAKLRGELIGSDGVGSMAEKLRSNE